MRLVVRDDACGPDDRFDIPDDGCFQILDDACLPTATTPAFQVPDDECFSNHLPLPALAGGWNFTSSSTGCFAAQAMPRSSIGWSRGSAKLT